MQIDGNTKLTGLFGNPVEHSMSPAMHNQAFKELDLNYRYLAFAIEDKDLARAIDSIRALKLAGVNVTIPYKEDVIPYLDGLSKEAELIGAVNTIVRNGDKLIGHNTDGRGFIRSLEEECQFDCKAKTALIIGAGGAARAVAFQTALAGLKRLYISDLNLKLAKRLADDIKDSLDLEVVVVNDLDNSLAKQIDLLVDATPVGMYPEVNVNPVVDKDFLHADLTVVDLVYNPRETVLLKAAQKVGAQNLSGLFMLVYQGAIAFELWTGSKAPIKLMTDTISTKL